VAGCWPGRCWLPCRELFDPLDELDDPDELDEPDELDGPDALDEPLEPVDDAPPPGVGPNGIGGRFNRSCGMSGGGTGGCPLISSAPLALFSSVAQPPLPKVAPMLQATWRLPADQLGSDSVL